VANRKVDRDDCGPKENWVVVRNYKELSLLYHSFSWKQAPNNINKQLKSNQWMCSWEFCWYLSHWWVLRWRCPVLHKAYIEQEIRVWSLETTLLPLPPPPPPINFHDIFDYSKPSRAPILRGMVLWDIPTHLIHKTWLILGIRAFLFIKRKSMLV